MCVRARACMYVFHYSSLMLRMELDISQYIYIIITQQENEILADQGSAGENNLYFVNAKQDLTRIAYDDYSHS